MLPSLEITNFRTFSYLRIERLGQVNLILGKNNVGKTTLLEALQIYGSPWPAITAREVLGYRGESVASNGDIPHTTITHGREDDTRISSIGPLEKRLGMPTLEIIGTIRVGTKNLEPTGSDKRISLLAKSFSSFDFEPRPPNGSEGYISQTNAVAASAVANPKPTLLRPISARAMIDETATRWDSLALTSGESLVVDQLRKIAPLNGIRYVGRLDGGGMAIVSLEGAKTPTPLMSQGEGIARMFYIATALVHAALEWKSLSRKVQLPNMFPCLLIDEFEIGVHHSLHADLWRFVIKTAHELGVQVFATTHSWDCLKGFAEAVSDMQDCDALAIRLEDVKNAGQTGAITIDRSDLPVVVSESIEVR